VALLLWVEMLMKQGGHPAVSRAVVRDLNPTYARGMPLVASKKVDTTDQAVNDAGAVNHSADLDAVSTRYGFADVSLHFAAPLSEATLQDYSSSVRTRARTAAAASSHVVALTT
jgi:hypothetical protein